MMNKIVLALSKLNRNLVVGIMLLIIGLIVLEGWMLLLRKPYTEYKQIVDTKESLALALSQSPDQSSQMSHLANELKQLTEQLSGELKLPASDDKMAASFMAALDHAAKAHGVSLFSVKPKDRKTVSVFEEVSFEVSAKGSYLHLTEWMLDFTNALGNNATVTEFEMKTVEEGKQVLLTLNIALYRPLKFGEMTQ